MHQSTGWRKALKESPLRDVALSGQTFLRETRWAVEHHRATRRARGLEPTHLHIGCGGHRLDGWLNVDMDPRADLQLDGRRPLPFRSDTCQRIFSEHFVEHLDRADADNYFRECFRVLAPGGELLTSVPDSGEAFRRYVATNAPVEVLEPHIRQAGQHRSDWDLETLTKALLAVGFVRAGPTVFDPRIESAIREVGSVRVSAVKSG